MDNITNIFIQQPNNEYHVREIARMLKISPTTTSKYLNNLKKEGLLISKKERSHLLFKANTENKSYKDLKLYHNIKNIRNSGLIKHLNKELNYPESIILFGSFKKATNTSTSDIDLFILTPTKKTLNLYKFEKILNHNIQLFIYSKKEFEILKKDNKELLNNIINGISLEGFLEVF